MNETPEIIINKPYVCIKGNSCAEDCNEFWYPVIKDFEFFAKEWQVLTVDFKFNYYNTGSLYYLTRILTILKEMSTGAKVEINWYYHPRDTDMYEIGKEFKDTISKKINLIKLHE